MLNIVVGMKQVPDIEELYEEKGSTINRTETSLLLNPLDKYALSEALKLKEIYGGTVKTLSMGPVKCGEVLKEVIAVGVDESILITGAGFKGADTYATAYTLAKAIQKLKHYDLVITGNKSMDGDTGQVGPSLAEFLNVPHVTNVSQIQQISEGGVWVQKKTERGYVDIVLPLPAVLCVMEEVCEIVYPTISDIAERCEKKVLYWGIDDIDADEDEIGYKGSKTKVTRVYKVYESTKGTCKFISSKGDREKFFQKIMKGIV